MNTILIRGDKYILNKRRDTERDGMWGGGVKGDGGYLLCLLCANPLFKLEHNSTTPSNPMKMSRFFHFTD